MGAVVFDEFEGLGVLLELLADEHFEGGFGGFKLIAFAFHALHFGQNRLHFRSALGELETEGFSADQHVGLAAHVADGDDALVAHQGGIHVLIGACQLLHGVHVQPALVGEGGHADVWGADVMLHVGQFIHEVGEVAQLGQVDAEIDAHLDLQVGHHGDEITIPHAFAVAVDGALHLVGTGAHGGQGIGDADAAIIVGVDAHGLAQEGDDLASDFFDKLRQGTAIGFAQHNQISTGIAGGLDGLERVLGIFAEAVEKVLGIVQHLATVLLQVGNGVGDHREVFLQGDLEDLGDVQGPGLAHDGDGRRLRIEQHLHLGVFFDLHLATAGHAEGGDFGRFPGPFGGLLEEGGVLGVGTGPAAFDVMNTKLIQPFSDADLVERAEGDAGALGAVAQGGVVDSNRGHEGK